MEKEFEELAYKMMDYNPHWCRTYGRVLMFLSSIKLEDCAHLIEYPSNEDDTDDYDLYRRGQDLIYDLLESKGYIFEGYTLAQVSSFLITFFKEWHSKHKEVQIKLKQEKIKELEKELEELKRSSKSHSQKNI